MSLRASACFDAMAVSPPRSPEQPAPPSPSTLPPLNLNYLARTPLEAAVQTFLVEEEDLVESAYVYFEHTNRTCLVSQSRGVERINQRAVLPHIVVADRVDAGSVLSPDGDIGSLFRMFEGDQQVASVEVYSDRVVIVHASFSRDAVDAGAVPRSTRLEFRADHEARMREAMEETDVDTDLTYIPLTEVLWNPRVSRLVVGGEAGAVWQNVCKFLSGINKTVVHAIDRHNQHEFASACVPPTELPRSNLAAIFC